MRALPLSPWTVKKFPDPGLPCSSPGRSVIASILKPTPSAMWKTIRKFTRPTRHAKAEALVREASAALQAMGPQPDFCARVLLSAIGDDVAIGISCKANARPVRTLTSLGSTETVPVRATFVYSPVTPPPDRNQMDQSRMNAAIKANTEATVYAPTANAFPVLRQDINGKLFYGPCGQQINGFHHAIRSDTRTAERCAAKRPARQFVQCKLAQ